MVNDKTQVYELQEYDAAYDSVPFESQVRNVKIHEKSSGGGRLQTVLQLIQLILLVILLIAVAAIYCTVSTLVIALILQQLL